MADVLILTADGLGAARAAALRAAEHADDVARAEGWLLGEGLWQDEASDRLYDERAELGETVYKLAVELLGEESNRRRREEG